MAPEGFVWMDDAPPKAAPSAPPRSIGHLRPLPTWRPPEPSRWRGRLTAIALAALGGRRTLLVACLELTEAIGLELRRALERC